MTWFRTAGKRIRPKHILWAGIIGLCILLLVIAYQVSPIEEPIDPFPRGTIGVTEPVMSGETVSQLFVAEHPVRDLLFSIGTYHETFSQGTLRVSIVSEDTGETVYTKDFQADALHDNQNLRIEPHLPEGTYNIQFTPEDFEEGKPICLYTSHEPSSIAGYIQYDEEYEDSIYLGYYYNPASTGAQNAFLRLELLVLGMTAIGLLVEGLLKARKKENRKQLLLTALFGFLCFAASGLILYFQFGEMVQRESFSFMRNDRMLFYCVVLLLMGGIWCFLKDYSEVILLFIMSIGMVLIFADFSFNPIDENAHAAIITYIVENYSFPNVYDNYEAVQGPLSYYLSALLVGWLPEDYMYIGARIVGAILMVLNAVVIRKTLREIETAFPGEHSERFVHILWLLFSANPMILIRFTRVSNEPLMCLFSSLAILDAVRLILHGYKPSSVVRCTILCALAFLTKSTSFFLFGIVFLVCAYYKKWKAFFLQLALYVIIPVPWFISNYMTYGALTAMKGHLEFVLPIVNPGMEPPDVWNYLQQYFVKYFISPEPGVWYDLLRFEEFANALLLIFLESAIIFGIGYLIGFVKNRLQFDHSTAEQKRFTVMTFAALPAVCYIVHIIQSFMTYNISVGNNRYAVMLNSAFCGLMLLGSLKVSKKFKTLLVVYLTGFFAVVMTSLICGYVEVVMSTPL